MKKVLSLLLCLVILLSLYPVEAFSEEKVITNGQIEAAIKWATDNVNNTKYKNKCLAFVKAAYSNAGLSINRTDFYDSTVGDQTAKKAGEVLVTNTDKKPPRGALVFWEGFDTYGNNVGHVGISLGNGRVVHQWGKNHTIDEITKYANLTNKSYMGWGAPVKGSTLATDEGASTDPTPPTVAKSGTYNGHTYERYDSSITWKEAKAFCESKGGHLVTISDNNENTWIANTLLSGCSKNVYFIGATDESSEGTWKWVTGETFWTGGRNGSVKSGFYANWDQDYREPTDNTGENYAAIMGKNVGSNKQVGDWIDIQNEGGTGDYSQAYCGFICEYEPKTYTVSYNANGGSGAPGNQTKTQGQNLTLSKTKPSWSGHTFLGWAESATATSALYQPGGNYTKDSTVTLYAVWRLNKLSLQYNANGGSIGTNEYDFSLGANSAILRSGNSTVSTWTYGTTYTGGLINNTTFGLSRQGYSFKGWCMKADGSTTVYDQNVDLTPETLYPDLKNGDGTITLYAIWSADDKIPVLTDKGYSDVTAKTAVFNGILTFNPEIRPTMWGIDITTDPDNWASSDVPLTINRRVSENQTSPIAIRIDFARDVDESKNPLEGNTTYYYRFWAQYVLDGQTKSVHSQVNSFVTLAEYTITYNANGGSGAPGNQTKTHGTALTLSSTRPTWSGHTFLGWAESASATSAQYQPGGNYIKNSATTLYAVWQPVKFTSVLTLPGSLTTIESEAFVSIDAEAVIIPASVKSIARDAFDGGITVIGEPGSEAETFASERKLAFIPLSDYKAAS